MEDRNYYINQSIGNSGVSEVEKFNTIGDYTRQQDPTFLMKESRLRPNSGTYFGASSSRWDKNLPSVDQLMAEGLTADQARGEEQTVFNRIGNALINNAVIAGTTAISGSLGVIWGALDAISNQELNKLYDNAVNRKMLEWQESAAQAAPNYYTKDYSESSIWKKLGTSVFWADLIKNLGFTEGMLIPGMGVSSALSKAPLAAQLIGSSVAGALSEASTEALQVKQNKLNLENTQIADEYNKAILAAKSPEEKALIDQEYKKTLLGIEEDANKAGNYVLGYNMALLTLSNSLEWGKLFTRGNKASRAALLAKERSKGIKVGKDGLSLNIEQPWLNTAKNIGERGFQAFTEGTEEVLQDVAVKSADLNLNYNSFNESVFNPEKRELANGAIQSLGMAFSQAMKDPDTATDFAMGFLTSVVGSPRFRSPKENGQWRSPMTMEGGVTEFLRERREYGKRRALVNEINERLSDPTLEEYYKGIVRDTDLTDKANLALEAGDDFNFHNYQFASMVSDIIMLDNAGQFGLFNTILEKASAVSDADIKSLIDSGLFQQNGNPMSVEDVRSKIQENVGIMQGLASQYREMKESLEASKNGSQLSKDALENIIYAKMQLDNWKKRQTDISNELMGLYKDEIYDSTDEKAVSPEHFRLLATLPVIRNELKKLVEESELTDDVKETWIKKIDDLNKIQDNMKKFSDKINEYYSSPQKANAEQEKIKEKAVKKDQKKKTDTAKESLQKATTPRELRNVYNNILSQGDVTEAELERALNELAEEGNPVAKENKNIQSLYQGTVAKISEMGLEDTEIANAIQMLNNAMNSAKNVGEMIEPSNPNYTEATTFFNMENPSSGDPALDKQTFLSAQVAVAKALQKQLMEMGKNAEAAKFTTSENPAPGTNESGTTGNSGVSEVPSAKGHDSIPSASITSESGEPGVNAGNLPANYDNSGVEQQPNTNESQKKEIEEETSTDPNKSWFPLSWFFLGSKKKGVLIPISDTQAIQKEDASVNFGQIPQWIEQNRAQEYVDTGNLKVGDNLVLGIPSDLKDTNGNPVIVYYKVEDNNHIPVGIFTASGNLAKDIKSKILEEYKKADQSKPFFSSITTTVNDVKTGYVEYGESRNLDSTDNITFAIVRNGSLDLGASSIKLNEVNRPKNISQKNGMVYIAIPNSRKGMSGGYTLVGAKVKKFSSKEFDLTSPKNAESSVVKNIRKSVEAIINAKTQADLLNRVQELSKYLYIPNLNFYIVEDGTIRVTRNILDSSGNVIKKLVKKADGTSVYENSETVVGVYKDPEILFGDLYKMGLNFNIDRTSINTPEYNKTILDSGIVSINAVNTNHTVGGWFTANPVGENGEIKGSKIPFNNPTPSNTPKSNDNSIIVTINNKQVTLFPTGEYLSLKDGVRRLPTNLADVERYKALYTLQKQYGNATEGPTMWNNKAIVGDRVIDRTTGEWVTGAAADEVFRHVYPKPIPASTIKSRTPKDSIVVTRTYNGYSVIFGKENKLKNKTGDIRKKPNGWGKNENGLVYYKKELAGRSGDNITFWFEEELSDSDKKIIESIADAIRLDTNKFNELDYIKGTSQEVQSSDILFQNHDDMNPIEDLSDNSKLPNSKVGYYLDSRDKKIHKTYMVSAGEILGTPVQIIKIPVLTSGLNSKGPKKVAGYNYGIVLPNGQSYIGTNLNVETPINTVFEGIKKSFEGPGAGPRGQEFVEKHKKEFTELKNMPSVFPTEVATPIDTEVKQETPTTTTDNDEMSFEDFAALMGANIGGNPTAKLREAKKESEKFDIDKEVKWLSTVLPNIPVEVVRGLIHIAGKNAWGTFSNAGITLSNVAAEGTAYHEAFHAVFSLGLNGNERANLMKEASEESKLTDPVELEEWLAERFREYVINQKSKTIGQKIKEFFKKLWNLIRGIQEAEPMRYSIYKKIMSSKYKNMKIGTTEESSTRLRPEEYTPEMLDILSTAKYDKDGNILAPNGKPSNLNERQWVHVRTKAFKEWFGDWEKYAPKSDFSKVEEQLVLVFERIPELSKIGSIREYAAYLADKFPNSVDRNVYWHGTNEDFSEGFKSAKKGKGSGAPETQSRNDFYLAKQAWTVLQYVNGVNRNSVDKNGFAHWNKLWWELKEIMSNGRRENNNWKDMVIGEETVRQGIPNKKGVFNRDKGGSNGKWLSERKADYGYENKSDKEFFEDILGIQWGKDTFNTWTKRNAEVFKALEKTQKGIYPAIINTQNPIREKGQNTYYEEQRGLFTQAERENNDAILGEQTDNEFGSDVAVVLNASEKNVHFLGTKEDVEGFKKWLEENHASKVVDENGEPLVVWHSGMSEIKDNIFRNKVITTINKEEEWVTDKSIEDYIKEGYIISEEDIAKYNEGKDVEIAKPNAIYASSERDVSNSYTKKSYEASIEFDEEVEDRAEQKAEDWGNEEYYLYLDFLKTTRDKELASKMTDEEMLKRHPEGKEEYISPTNPYEYKDTPIGTELALFSAIKNPLIVDAHKSNWNDISFNGETHTTRTLEKYARNNGYDGIIVKNVLDIGPYGRLEAHKFSTIVAAMNPNQIKSATDNTGTYSRKNDDIRLRKVKEDNELFLENGYSENWIKNATEEEKEVAKYCIGI